MTSAQDDADIEDRSAFESSVTDCLNDDRIIRYFEHGYVKPGQVLEMLPEDIFDQAKRTEAYQIYTSLRTEMTLKGQRRPTAINYFSYVIFSHFNRSRLAVLRQIWLSNCIEEIIMPNLVLAINTILGKDKDKLLVERDSEGLRKLQDPAYRVPTRSEEKLVSVLSRMDGGSIALAGPRGAGKSTLLKKFCQPNSDDLAYSRGISVYVPAPAEYVAQEFIAELFQRLCEAYLMFCNYPVPNTFYGLGRSRKSFRKIIGKVLALAWLSLRALIAISLVTLTSLLLFENKFVAFVFGSTLLEHWTNRIIMSTRGWSVGDRLFFWVGIVLLAWACWPKAGLWRNQLRSHKEPRLVKQAREYLLRLQVDKTVTWGANVTSPGVWGMGLGANKGASVKYPPWTLPELVAQTRRFLQEISQQLASSNRAIMVGIDEIDRIGSIDQAERFIGEIKAVFGVEGCFFLVAVAEDVGSLFAQRATAGRSILENAFDEIIAIDPLRLDEARPLLLKRVPGFTDAFVYLVLALSGGLPRELIRVTRRLIEVNLEQSRAGTQPRLDDLAFILVVEGLIEALKASRSQMSGLILSSDWAALFDSMRSASIALHRVPFARNELYEVIGNISESGFRDDPLAVVQDDEDRAKRIVNSLSAYAYFGIIVIDAFADQYFSLDGATRRLNSDAGDSYEELAAARLELSISTGSARMMLRRFRDSLRFEYGSNYPTVEQTERAAPVGSQDMLRWHAQDRPLLADHLTILRLAARKPL